MMKFIFILTWVCSVAVSDDCTNYDFQSEEVFDSLKTSQKVSHEGHVFSVIECFEKCFEIEDCAYFGFKRRNSHCLLAYSQIEDSASDYEDYSEYKWFDRSAYITTIGTTEWTSSPDPTELTSPTEVNCVGDGWLSYETGCYYITDVHYTWAEADEACLRFNGELVIIDSEEELNMLKSAVEYNEYWVGIGEDGQWFDGSSVNMTWFEDVDVENISSCVVINQNGLALTKCDDTSRFICQYGE